MKTNPTKKIIITILKFFARYYVVKNEPQVTIIAGTTGRHWVKERVIKEMKKSGGRVRGSMKNFNAEVGLSLSIRSEERRVGKACRSWWSA